LNSGQSMCEHQQRKSNNTTNNTTPLTVASKHNNNSNKQQKQQQCNTKTTQIRMGKQAKKYKKSSVKIKRKLHAKTRKEHNDKKTKELKQNFKYNKEITIITKKIKTKQ